MDGSIILAWIVLGFAVLAAGTLVHTYIRPNSADRASQLLTKSSTAIALVITLGPLPRLFRLESNVVRWGVVALAAVLLVFAFVQLHRYRRLIAMKVDSQSTV